MQLETSLPVTLPIGERVRSLRRVLFCDGAQVRGSEGPFEVGFSDGRVLLFECGSSGADLRITESAWVDRFAEPLSAEHEELVVGCGKWEAFDLGSSVWSYRRLLGRVLESVEMDDGSAIHLRLEGSYVEISAEADELKVDFY